MKYKFFALMGSAYLIYGSNFCLAALAVVNSPQATAPVVESEAVINGVAAVVDNEAITTLDVQERCSEKETSLRQNYKGDALLAKIKENRIDVLNALIDELVIIHSFKNSGGSIKDPYIQYRIHMVVRDEFLGNEKKLQFALADSGVTLNEYKKEISDAAIVRYMTARNVAEKIKVLKPASREDEEKLTQSTQVAWLDSLRQQAYIKNFWEAKRRRKPRRQAPRHDRPLF